MGLCQLDAAQLRCWRRGRCRCRGGCRGGCRRRRRRWRGARGRRGRWCGRRCWPGRGCGSPAPIAGRGALRGRCAFVAIAATAASHQSDSGHQGNDGRKDWRARAAQHGNRDVSGRPAMVVGALESAFKDHRLLHLIHALMPNCQWSGALCAATALGAVAVEASQPLYLSSLRPGHGGTDAGATVADEASPQPVLAVRT